MTSSHSGIRPVSRRPKSRARTAVFVLLLAALGAGCAALGPARDFVAGESAWAPERLRRRVGESVDVRWKTGVVERAVLDAVSREAAGDYVWRLRDAERTGERLPRPGDPLPAREEAVGAWPARPGPLRFAGFTRAGLLLEDGPAGWLGWDELRARWTGDGAALEDWRVRVGALELPDRLRLRLETGVRSEWRSLDEVAALARCVGEAPAARPAPDDEETVETIGVLGAMLRMFGWLFRLR